MVSCRIGTDRVKKGAGERNYMDWLKEILGEAHTEDIDKKIAGYIGKNFVSKSDFKAETDKVRNLEGQITERDSQLEALNFPHMDIEIIYSYRSIRNPNFISNTVDLSLPMC